MFFYFCRIIDFIFFETEGVRWTPRVCDPDSRGSQFHTEVHLGAAVRLCEVVVRSRFCSKLTY